jgi:L-amino acid N-acyltransferase YncA
MIDLLNPIIEERFFTVMDRPLSLADQVAFIRGFPDEGIFNVAVADDTFRMLGLQDVMPRSTLSDAPGRVGEVSTFVSLDSHRHGVGRGLCEATFPEARRRGFRKLCATIRADNPQAVAFYLSQGFAIVRIAERHALVRGKYVDEILTEKFLDGD